MAAESLQAKKTWMHFISELLSTQEGNVNRIEKDSLNECRKSGWVTLSGVFINQRKWLRLHGNTLFFFSSEKTNVPDELVYLYEYSIMPAPRPPEAKPPLAFKLHHPSKKSYLLYF